MTSKQPFAESMESMSLWKGCHWPVNWISAADACVPFVAAFRLKLNLSQSLSTTIYVSADERYQLYIDGRRVGRGPERPDANNWFYESYPLELGAGEHVVVARVWALGNKAPLAQMSVQPGFLLAAEEPFTKLLSTGHAAWEARIMGGYEFLDFSKKVFDAFVGKKMCIVADRFAWGFERGEGEGWQPAKVLSPPAVAHPTDLNPVRLMSPATLPSMHHVRVTGMQVKFTGAVEGPDLADMEVKSADHIAPEVSSWQSLLDSGTPLTIPPHTRRRILVDLENYYCAYVAMTADGGRDARVDIHWAESLFETSTKDYWHRPKGDRGRVLDKSFMGMGHTFLCDGGADRRFETLWWEAGRYLQIFVQTQDAPLTLKSLELEETRYPTELAGRFECSDERLEGIVPILLRGLQMCSHETFMDCPYYEQLQYVGDSRLEALATYVCMLDDRLARKCIRMFDQSRLPSGLTQSRYPCRARQVIPPFSLWWVCMVHDYAMWRGDEDFVRRCMPGVRAVMDAMLSCRNADGLLEGPPGWNFVDWVVGWNYGMPREARRGASGVLNWQFVYTLSLWHSLEAMLGEKELARRADRLADEQAKASMAFYDAGRGLLADTLAKDAFSEHAQCMALLSGRLDGATHAKVADGLLSAGDLAATTIYFRHYLFETFRQLGRAEKMFDRMDVWFILSKLGFKTTPEQPEPSRSDCHGWGAHPLYHYFATILGIRPAAMGFAKVEIRPQLGPLRHVAGRLQHPKGWVEAEIRQDDAGKLSGSISLPRGVQGVLLVSEMKIKIRGGRSTKF